MTNLSSRLKLFAANLKSASITPKQFMELVNERGGPDVVKPEEIWEVLAPETWVGDNKKWFYDSATKQYSNTPKDLETIFTMCTNVTAISKAEFVISEFIDKYVQGAEQIVKLNTKTKYRKVQSNKLAILNTLKANRDQIWWKVTPDTREDYAIAIDELSENIYDGNDILSSALIPEDSTGNLSNLINNIRDYSLSGAYALLSRVMTTSQRYNKVISVGRQNLKLKGISNPYNLLVDLINSSQHMLFVVRISFEEGRTYITLRSDNILAK
jgi:hypothetical protein